MEWNTFLERATRRFDQDVFRKPICLKSELGATGQTTIGGVEEKMHK